MTTVEDTRQNTQAEELLGSTFELCGALLAVLFALVGLAIGARFHMAAFGTIAVGFALLAHGCTMATRWSHAVARARAGAFGIASGVVGGLAAVTLGVVAASEVRPVEVLPVAMLVLGGAMLVGGPTQLPLVQDRARRWFSAAELVRTASGVMVMSGLAAMVLAAFALRGGPSFVLTLIAVLCAGAALLVAGGALPVRIARRFA